MGNTTAQTISYPDRLQNFGKNSRDLSSAQPSVMKAFWGLHTAAMADGALDTKTKELIALAISVATRCDDCISHHIYDALEAGGTKEEISDALGVAVLMGGGTSVVYATHVSRCSNSFPKALARKHNVMKLRRRCSGSNVSALIPSPALPDFQRSLFASER